MFRLFGDHRDRLDPGRPCADDTDVHTAEIDRIARPLAGMEGQSFEGIAARDIRHVDGRQAACRHHAERCLIAFPAIRYDGPPAFLIIECGRNDPGVQLDAVAKTELVGDVIHIAQNFGLGRIAFRPVPFLLQLLGKLIGIFHAFDIAAGTGITVPVPRAADFRPGFQHLHVQTLISQPVQQVQSRKPGADDDNVQRIGIGPLHHCGGFLSGHGLNPYLDRQFEKLRLPPLAFEYIFDILKK